MQKKERIIWIDQLKAIGFIFVILGHMKMDSTVKSYIYSFHMPLFFMISGLTLNTEKILNTSFKDYFKKLFQRMVIPYFWIEVLCLAAICVIEALPKGSKVAIGENIKGIFVANGLIMDYPSRAMYFILVLFLAQLVLWFFIHLTKGNRFSLGVCCLLFSTLSLFFYGKAMPWRINVVPAAVLLIFIGRILMDVYLKHKEKLESMNALKYLALCAVFLALGVVYWKHNGRVSMAANKYGESIFMAFVSATFTSVALALLVMKLPKSKALFIIGQNTLFYMGFHKLIISFFEQSFPQYKKEWPFVFAVCAFTFIILLPAVLYCRKFCPYLLGSPSGKDNAFLIIGKIINIAVGGFVPWFFVAGKLFDLGVTKNLVIASLGYVALIAIGFFILQKLPFFYIQKKSREKKIAQN